MNERKRQNSQLPKYWRLKNGTYMYRVPPALRDKHGGKTEISLGQTLAAAYQKFATFYIVEEKSTKMSDLLDRYRIEVVPAHISANTRTSKERSLVRLRSVLGANPIDLITPQVIYQYRDKISRDRSKKQANLDLEVLSHCFTKAIEWGVVSDHPMTNKKVVKFSLPGRDRYVEDWELQAWATVANPFLVVYVVLKGVTGLRQQDLLTLRHDNISDTELASVNIKTGKKLRFPLYDSSGEPTTVKAALDIVKGFYSKTRPSPWVFQTRAGRCYYNMETRKASGFQSIWQRSMKKAIEMTDLQVKFTEHDLRAKVGSDIDSLVDAQGLLAHASATTTERHYRLRGALVKPAKGFSVGKPDDCG